MFTKNPKRDSFVDSWRGIFHIILTLDHLSFIFPAASTILIGGFELFGFISVAEGFVFLSGYVAGLIYTRTRREKGARYVWLKSIVRSFQIYVCYVIAVMVFVAIVKCGGEFYAQWGAWSDLIKLPFCESLIRVVFLLNQPDFLEILPMYCCFLLAIPTIIYLLEVRQLKLILIVSVSLWVASQFGLRDYLVVVGVPKGLCIQIGYFNALAWQILFVFGVICGRKSLDERQPHWLPQSRFLCSTTYIIAFSLFMLKHQYLGIRISHNWTDASALGPIRLLNFFCVAFLICRFRTALNKCISWQGFAFLSKHSLLVFAFHLYPIYLLTFFIDVKSQHSIIGQLTIFVFCVGSLFVIAFFAKHFSKYWFCLFNQRTASANENRAIS